MKKIILLALLFVPLTTMAQQDKDASAGEESLFEKVTKIEKKQATSISCSTSTTVLT